MEAVIEQIKDSIGALLRDASPQVQQEQEEKEKPAIPRDAAYKKLNDVLQKQGEFLAGVARDRAFRRSQEMEEDGAGTRTASPPAPAPAPTPARAPATGEGESKNGEESKGEDASEASADSVGSLSKQQRQQQPADHPDPLSPLGACTANFQLPKHTIVYIHLLWAEIQGNSGFQWPDPLWEAVQGLLLKLDAAQLKPCPRIFFNICQAYSERARASGPASAAGAVLPLQAAARASMHSPSVIVPAEAELLHCCIASKHYGAGARWLDEKPLMQVDPAKTGLTNPHYLRFLYYAGHIMTSLRRWQDALLYYQCAISTPASVLSSIVLECYKKFLLVGLIAGTPRVGAKPSHHPSIIQRSSGIPNRCTTYTEFANAFHSGDASLLKTKLESLSEEFAREGNLGLAQSVVAALTRRKIQRLTLAFMTLSLDEIAKQVGLENAEEAEENILQMVEMGEISASIEHPSGMVNFREDETSENRLLAELSKEMDATLSLTKHVRELEARFSVTASQAVKAVGGQAADKHYAGASSSFDDGGDQQRDQRSKVLQHRK